MEQDLEITPNVVIPILSNEIAVRDDIRAMDDVKRARETYHIPYSRIETRPGHNGRTENNPGFTKESLEELARSILSIGLLEPLIVDLLKTGKAVITAGERRWRAIGIIRNWHESGNIKELIPENLEREIPTFDKVECFVNSKTLNERDKILIMLAENSGIHLTPLEQAEAIARLKQDGMSAAQIAKSIPGMNAMQVSLRLSLANLSDEEKDRIKEGVISPTAAVLLSKQESDPEKRLEIIDEAADSDDGKLKIRNIQPVDLDTGEIVSPEEAADALRNSDLKTGADSEPLDINDDPSMRGTSPRASTPSGDPAQKAKDDIDQADERITSGRATAHDLVLKITETLKQIDLITEGFQVTAPKLTTFIYEADKMLTDLKAILKK